MKTFYDVVKAIICCAKEARASIVLDIEWVQIVLHCCEKLQNWGAAEQRLIVLFSSDVMKKSMFKRLVYTPPNLSPRFTCKVNLSNTKIRPDFFILASLLLDKGMEHVNWLPPRTIVCFIKLYFGAVQLSIVSLTEHCWRDWWMRHYDATANANTIHNTRIGLFVFQA